VALEVIAEVEHRNLDRAEAAQIKMTRTATGQVSLPALVCMVQRQAASQAALLIALNPVIRGWEAYYRAVVSKEVFASCDYHLMSTLKHWMDRRHGHKGSRWVFNKMLPSQCNWPTGVLNTSRSAPGTPC
jgi:Group II intron, maturase-specific domain